MPETTRNGGLRQEVDEIREQVWLLGERHDDIINGIRQLVAAMTTNPQAVASLAPVVPTLADSDGMHAAGNMFNEGNKYSRVEILKFSGEDLKRWV